MKKLAAAMLGFGMCATPSVAVELTGGSVGLSYSAFADDTDFDRLSLEGSAEFAFDRNVSGQFDVGLDRFGLSDLEALTLGLHGIYHVNETTSLGIFYSKEDVDAFGIGTDIELFGLEAGHEVGQTDVEGYFARGEAEGANGTLLGVKGRYEMNSGLGIGGRFDYVDIDGMEAGKLTMRLDRDVSANVNLYVEVGSAKARAFGITESEPFVGLGGKIVFGADRGATFERRGLSKVLPGL